MLTFEKSNPQCKLKFLHAAGIYGIFFLSLSGIMGSHEID
jgi:hypothetical protein